MVLKCMKPKYKIFVKDQTILIHKEDVSNNGWGLVKLSMMMSYNEYPNWYVETYTDPKEFNWKVILWNPKKK